MTNLAMQSTEKNGLKVVYLPISKLSPSTYNPRTWDQKAISDLTKSIKENGFLIPILVNNARGRENVVIAGHFRLKIAKDLGMTTVPVNYVSVPNIETEQKLNLTLNRVSGDWDYELLKNFNIELLLESGFDDINLSHIWDENLSVEDDDFNVDEAISKIKAPKTKSGDLIILGDHRLYCGDSLNPKSVETLVGEHRIHMLNFDPIYNIGLDYDKGMGTKNKYGGKVTDNKTDNDYKAFLKTVIQNGLRFVYPDSHIFCWCDQKYIGMLQSLYIELGITSKRVCLWIKNGANPTPQIAFNKCYEPCVYGTIGNPYLSSVHNLTEVLNKEVGTGNRLTDDILDILDIWLVKRISGQDYQHPTQKPPSLYEKALRRCSKPGDIVLDLCAGSGAQMSACEQLKRRLFMCEIEPIFCDVIVARYKALTGKEAIYVNSQK